MKEVIKNLITKNLFEDFSYITGKDYYKDLINTVNDILYADKKEYEELYKNSTHKTKELLDTLYQLYEGDYDAIIKAYKSVNNK